MSTADLIYKIATEDAFGAARGAPVFTGMPIDEKDGYIHLSTAEQLPETLRLHFGGQSKLVLLAVRATELGQALVWEPSRGGAMFPHLYGSLPTSAIAWEKPISVGEDGSCLLPEAVR